MVDIGNGVFFSEANPNYGLAYLGSRTLAYVTLLQEIVAEQNRIAVASGDTTLAVATVGDIIRLDNAGRLSSSVSALLFDVRARSDGGIVAKLIDFGKQVGDAAFDGITILDGGQLGIAFGSAIAQHITDDPFERIAASAALKTSLGAFGEFIDSEVFNTPSKEISTDFLGNGINGFLEIAFENLIHVGVGAVSSYITAELIEVIGVEGVAGDALNTFGGAVIQKVVSNLVSMTGVFGSISKAEKVFENVNGNLLVSAAASYLGSKLSTAIYQPDDVGGQIGSAVGSAYGSFVSARIFATLGVSPATFVAAVAVIVIYQTLGSLIGSLFGGTPRSGADVVWDAGTGNFAADNAYSRKGGSKEEALSLASAVGGNLNTVLAATGAQVLDSSQVQAGNYGKRKSTFVYRPTSTRSKRAITARFDGGQGAVDLINHGTFIGLNDLVEQLAGGDIYVKRGLAASLSNVQGNPNSNAAGAASHFSMEALLGDLVIAQDFSGFVEGFRLTSTLIAAQPESLFTAGWLITIARAAELGLNQRSWTDWIGGFEAFADEIGDGIIDGSKSSYANMEAYINSATGLREWDLWAEDGSYVGVSGDTILSVDLTVIEAATNDAAAQTIDLRSGILADQTGYIINGHMRDDVAHSGADFTAKTDVSRSIATNSLRGTASLTAASDAFTEADEQFRVTIGDGAGTYLQRGAANVTIVDATNDAHLMVGRSYASESDGHLVWRVSLSKAAAGAVTLDLVLNAGRAEAGIDYTDVLEVSANGTSGWSAASALTLAQGATEYFVRVAVTNDNVLNPTFDPYEFGIDGLFIPGSGNGEQKYDNVEGNERLTLSAIVSAGETHLENGDQTVSGVGTIIDGSNTDPLVWADDLIIHEGQTANVSVARSRAASTVSSFTYSTEDNRLLEIPVAATVDAGGGDDIVHASDLGDNVFGGEGNDTLYGGRLDDWLLGGDGDDVLNAGGQNAGTLGGDGNYLDGGAGNDTLIGREGSDWLEGGDGADTLTGGAGGDILTGGADQFDANGVRIAGDTLSGGAGDDSYLLRLGDGEDTVIDTDNATLAWNPADDTYLGSFSDDLRDLIALRYDSVLDTNGALFSGGALGAYVTDQYAGLSKDWLGYYTPGASSGSLDGGEDSVVLGQGIEIGDVQLQRSGTTATPGDDLIIKVMTVDANGAQIESGDQLTLQNWFANPFDRVEWLKFADGNEIRIGDLTSFVNGTNGDDTLIGTLGNDFVHGGDGNDKLFLLAGDDVGSGGTGRDFVAGDSGDDLIAGGSDDDQITGAGGNDTISGDGGNDELYGGDGADIISGGRGDDWLAGGGGDDVFKYSRGDGADTVVDELNGQWTAIWTRVGGWATGYSEDAQGNIVGPGGAIVRENVGSAGEPKIQWNGRFEFDSLAETLSIFAAAASGGTAQDGLNETNGDTIEFAPNIHIQDLVLENRGDDLVVHISSDRGGSGAFGGNDSLTLKDWNAGAAGSIERLAFFSTGILDLEATNIVAGSASDDAALDGSAGVDWITGGLGEDTINGLAGNDILSGNGGIDILDGGGGDDVLYGGDGDDILIGGQGADLLVGGAGSDWASYEDTILDIYASLDGGGIGSNSANGDSYSSIENLRGGNGSDTLLGDAGENILDGRAGINVLVGGSGDDTYIFEAPAAGGINNTTVREGQHTLEYLVDSGGASSTTFTTSWFGIGGEGGEGGLGPPHNPSLNALGTLIVNRDDTGEEVYSFGAVTQSIQWDPMHTWPQLGWKDGYAPTGNGQEIARSTSDYTIDSGDDTIELGEGIGFSNLTFETYTSGANIDDLRITLDTANLNSLLIANQFALGGKVEYLQFHDGLSANLGSLVLNGVATAGDDLIVGTASADTSLSGGLGNDVIFGGAGDDTLSGDGGDDVIGGGAGADILSGNANSLAADNALSWGDTVRYAGSSAGVTVDLRLATAQSGGDAAGDILSGFENVEGSWGYTDWLYGDDLDNRLFGFGGHDRLYGNAGEDVLVGGEGSDLLYGGDDDDNISGDEGNDFLRGDGGNDLLVGGEGQDRLLGGSGDDTLLGGAGDDSGASGYLKGGTGEDTLDGGDGNDDLFGEAGADTLIGGFGDDSLDGGADDDIFVLGRGDGSDTIFDVSGSDTIVLTEGITREEIWLSRTGNDLVVSVIGGTTSAAISDFFLDSNVIEQIVTSDGTLFLTEEAVTGSGQFGQLSLVDLMAVQSPTSIPDVLPLEVQSNLDKYWYAGGTPAPRADEGALHFEMFNDGANAFNLDDWPDLAPTGRSENLVDDNDWPQDVDNIPAGDATLSSWQNSSNEVSETIWSQGSANGPYGHNVVTLAAGNIDSDSTAGGQRSNEFTIDGSKAYEFTWYFKADQLDNGRIFLGLTGDVALLADTGVLDTTPHFTVAEINAANGYEAGKWYKAVGYVLPEGSADVPNGTWGGVFDTETGAKIDDLQNFRWNENRSGDLTRSKFLLSQASEQAGVYPVQFFKPEVRAIDPLYMVRGDENLDRFVDETFISGGVVEGWANKSHRVLDGEARWSWTEGPDGNPFVSLEVGQFDASMDGGGQNSNGVRVDPTKTYRYTQYFKQSDLGKHGLALRLSAQDKSGPTIGAGVENVADGQASSVAIAFWGDETQLSQSLIEDRWYKVVKYILPEDTPNDPTVDLGGVFDSVTGQKVAGLDVPTHRWANANIEVDTAANFMNYNQGAGYALGWSTHLGAPTLSIIPDGDLVADSADPFGLGANDRNTVHVLDVGQYVVDADGDISEFALNPDEGPAQGIVTVLDAAAGTFEYRPFADALGEDSFSVVVTDQAGNATIVPVSVDLDVRGVTLPPEVPSGGYTLTIDENSVSGALAGTIDAIDPDGDDSSVDYMFSRSLMTMVGGSYVTFSNDNQFRLERDTGNVVLNEGSFDYEAGPAQYNYELRITDANSGNGSRPAYTSLSVSVADVNEAHSLADAAIDVAYFGKALGPLVPLPDAVGFAINLRSAMLDDPENANMTWSVVGAPSGSPWSLGQDGTLYQLGLPSVSTDYSLTVRATDEDGFYQDAVLTISVGADDGSAEAIPAYNLGEFDFDFDWFQYFNYLPPIILDLDGDGIELISVTSSNVLFDMDANGTLDRTGWFGADDAVLAFDANRNGLVDDGSEISFQQYVTGAFSDLDGLAFFDSNANGELDSGDEKWGEFLVWQDSNSDGVSDAGELMGLTAAGIESINLTGTPTGNNPGAGDNVLYATSSFDRLDGPSGTVGDVFFVFDPNTPQPGDDDVTGDAGGDIGGDDSGSGDSADAESSGSAIEFSQLGFDRKTKKYRFSTLEGELHIAPRGSAGALDTRAGLATGATMFTFRNWTYGMVSAVILDLDNDGIETRRYKKSRAGFDMDGNGSRDNTGWTRGDDGFLVIDRNENGRIDDASEMAFLGSDDVLQHGRAGLLALDTNGDGLISADDDLFGKLQIWVDEDKDGITDTGELRLLSEHGIESISLNMTAVQETKKVGRNLTLSTSIFTRTDGTTGTMGDVALGFRPTASASVSGGAPNGRFARGQDIRAYLSEQYMNGLDQLSIDDLMEGWASGGRIDQRLAYFEELRDQLPSSLDIPGSAPASEDVHVMPELDIDASIAARLALMRQDLAAFGGTGDMHNWEDRRDMVRVPFDFFA